MVVQRKTEIGFAPPSLRICGIKLVDIATPYPQARLAVNSRPSMKDTAYAQRADRFRQPSLSD